MFMHTLLPEKAEILTRGGSGQEAWGHPLERTAQYNHTNRERSQPPICPWRMEIGDPAEAARTLFLNVFEITDEQVREAPDVTFVPAAGVKIGDRIIRFNATGPLGGVAGGIPLTTTINTATQYPTSN
ncbi:MAG: hypothetical protein JWM99_2174 [Verrucomicrobiales bacterium]|nr:hypothetical protein [Verrucomicrobiales bacterium]